MSTKLPCNTDKNYKAYQNLFSKTDFSEKTITIQDFQQPILVAVLETDDLLKSILKALYLVGYKAHLIEFKEALIYKKIASRGIIDRKIALLELIGAVVINDYYIKLNTQSVSYFKSEKTEPKIKIVEKPTLLGHTRAKMKLIDIDKDIGATKVANKIYRGDFRHYTVVTDSKETSKTHLKNIEKAIKLIDIDYSLRYADKLKASGKRQIPATVYFYLSKNICTKYKSNLIALAKNKVVTFARSDMQGYAIHLDIKFIAI